MANNAADLTVVSARDPSCQLFITASVEVTSLLSRRVVSSTDDSFERYLLNKRRTLSSPSEKGSGRVKSSSVNEIC